MDSATTSPLPASPRVLLISPPAYYPWSVPPGVAYLSGYLKQHGVTTTVIDANVGALEHVLVGGCRVPPLAISAFETLRDRQRSQDWKLYSEAMSLLSEVAEGISATHKERLVFARNTLRYYPAFERRSRAGLLAAARASKQHLFVQYYEDVLIRSVREQSPDVVGLSASDLHQLLPATVIASVLREQLGSSCPRLVFGGNVFSRIHDVLSETDDLNRALFELWGSVVVGEGERGLLELIIETARPTGAPIDGLLSPGATPSKGLPVSLDSLPAPNCDGFRPLSPEMPVPLNLYRGCYFSGVCEFCDINHGYDTLWAQGTASMTRDRRRRRHIDLVIDDIRQASKQYNTRIFNFTDEWFVAADMLELAECIIDEGLNIRWDAYARFEPLLADAAVCERLHLGGLRFLQFGLETASAESLKRIRKGITADLSSRVLRSTASAGLWNHVFVIVGLPGETLHDSLLTIDFLDRHANDVLTIKPTRFRLSRWSPMARSSGAGTVEVDQGLLKQRELSLDLPFRYSSSTKVSHRGVNATYAALELLASRHWAYPFSSLYPYHTRLRFPHAAVEAIAHERGRNLWTSPTDADDIVRSFAAYLRSEARRCPLVARTYATFDREPTKDIQDVPGLIAFARAWARHLEGSSSNVMTATSSVPTQRETVASR